MRFRPRSARRRSRSTASARAVRAPRGATRRAGRVRVPGPVGPRARSAGSLARRGARGRHRHSAGGERSPPSSELPLPGQEAARRRRAPPRGPCASRRPCSPDTEARTAAPEGCDHEQRAEHEREGRQDRPERALRVARPVRPRRKRRRRHRPGSRVGRAVETLALHRDRDAPGAGCRKLRARDLPAVRIQPGRGDCHPLGAPRERHRHAAHRGRRRAQGVEDGRRHEVLAGSIGRRRDVDEQVVGVSARQGGAHDRPCDRQRTAARGRERSRAGATRRRACRPPRPPPPGAVASTVAGGARRAARAARGRPWRPPMRAWRRATHRRSSRAGHRDSRPDVRRRRARSRRPRPRRRWPDGRSARASRARRAARVRAGRARARSDRRPRGSRRGCARSS